MGNNEKKRQKKLARKKQKRQRKRTQIQKHNLMKRPSSLLKRSASLEIHECLIAEDDLIHNGIGMVLTSRKIPDGNILCVVILLDVWCLGAKDTWFRIFTPSQYEELIDNLKERQSALVRTKPATMKKLVEDCVAWAAEHGMKPHTDYHLAQHIWDDIDPTEADEEFEYGQDGRPCYVSGPFEDAERIQYVLKTLEKHCGEGNYDFTCEIPEDSIFYLEES